MRLRDKWDNRNYSPKGINFETASKKTSDAGGLALVLTLLARSIFAQKSKLKSPKKSYHIWEF